MLLELPNELHELIVSYVRPSDFESLALCCKHFFEVCRPLIPGHNRHRIRWRHIVLRPNYHSDPGYRSVHASQPDGAFASTYDLLQQLSLDPGAGRWIISADLQDDDQSPAHLMRTSEGIIPEATICVSLMLGGRHGHKIRELFSKSPLLHQRCVDWPAILRSLDSDITHQRVICNAALGGHEGRRVMLPASSMAIALLLATMPNVKMVKLPPWFKQEAEHRNLCAAIVEAATDAESLGLPSSLRHLVRLGQEGTEEWPRVYLDDIYPFMSLPRLTDLNSAFESGPCSRSWNIPLPEASAFARLETIGVCIALNSREYMLPIWKMASGLKVLRCDIESYWFDQLQDDLDVITSHPTRKLEQLRLGLAPSWDMVGQRRLPKLCFQKFSSLTRLRIQWPLVFGSYRSISYDGTRVSDLMPEGDLDYRKLDPEGEALARWSLPELKEFRLYGSGVAGMAWTTELLFHDLGRQYTKILPKLEVVSLGLDDPYAAREVFPFLEALRNLIDQTKDTPIVPELGNMGDFDSLSSEEKFARAMSDK